jgi:molybdopterin molybdotransferase
VDTALDRLLENAAPVSGRETLPLLQALGRYAAADIAAELDVPPFDNSPLDGFALFHEDTADAAPEAPVRLRVVETLYAGDAPLKALGRGECARIMTGAAMPEGATCVVPSEAVREGADNGIPYAEVPFRLAAYQNYRPRGEDIAKGVTLLESGGPVGFSAVAALASQGIAAVPVYARVTAGILSTGSELVLPASGAPLPRGKLYDSNRYILGARVLGLGAEPCTAPPAADGIAALTRAAAHLLERCDALITTGGVSVGDRDFMPEVGKALHGKMLFRGVAMKPGGWATGFLVGRKIMLCLSGNPGAAAMTFDLLGGPLIRRLAGARTFLPVWQPVRVKTPLPKTSGTSRYVYARSEADGAVLLTGGFHGSQSGADSVIHIPSAASGCLSTVVS